MYTGQLVFSQLMDFLPRHEFNRCVRRYRGNYRVRKFSCLDQFLCMVFAQLTYRESLRDTETCLRAVESKLYHAGIRGRVSRSTLADANESIDWRIWADFAQVLIGRSRRLVCGRGLRPGLATERLRPGFDDHRSVSFAVPLGEISKTQGSRQSPHPDGLARQHPLFYPHHTRQCARCQHPRRVASPTPAPSTSWIVATSTSGVSTPSPGVWLSSWFAPEAIWFTAGVLTTPSTSPPACAATRGSDFEGRKRLKPIPIRFAASVYVDTDTRKRLVFLTNNFTLPALTIAHLYKCRWRVELFFKWIKQYLRIKAFYGTSPNAVKTQIWIAISVYLLVAILKKELKIERSLGEILQILSITLFEKVPMNQVLTRFPLQQETAQSCKQLILFEF